MSEKKIDLDKQVAAVRACLTAEGLRSAAKVARGEVTEAQEADGLAALEAALGTLEYLQSIRGVFLDFMRARREAGIR